MVKFAVVSASELGDRLDAGFHIALAEVRDRVKTLMSEITAEEAIRRLDGLALKDKAPLMVLRRGSAPALNEAGIARAVREYPHLALALIERDLAKAVERVRQEIAKNQSHLDALLDLTPSAAER